jgi:hypothetical protein
MLLKLSNVLRWIVLIPGALIATGCVYLLAFGSIYIYSWIHPPRGASYLSFDQINGIFVFVCGIFSGYYGVLAFISSTNYIAPCKKSETVRILCFLTVIILLIPIFFSSVNLLYIKSTDKSAVSLLWPLLSYLSSLYGLIPHALNFEFKYWKKSTLF